MQHHIPLTAEERAAAAALRKVASEIAAEHEDTDETIDARAGALPRHGSAAEVPDTQEALFAEDGIYRIDEVEGTGKRVTSPGELVIETDGLQVVGEDEL